MKILIYVPQFCIYSVIAGINDIFWIANNIIKSKNLLNFKNLSEINEFKVDLVSIDGKPVVNAQNKMIDVDLSIEEAISSDLIIVPGMMLSDEQTPIMPSEYKAVLKWLQN
ncbi:AraC family transcriptional regulator, partial [Acinetobacter baumannii]